MKIHFAESAYKIDPGFKKKYIAEIETAHKEVSKLLRLGQSISISLCNPVNIA